MKKRYPIITIILVIIIAFTYISRTSNNMPSDYSNMEGLNFPKSFEDFLEPYGDITNEDLFEEFESKYDILYKQINDNSISDEQGKEYINKFNTQLREMGFPLPFISFSAYLNTIKDLTDEDRTKLLALYEEYSYNDDYEESEKQISDILKDYNLNGIEVLDQLSSYNYKYAIFTINGESIKLDKSLKTNVKNISKEKESLYVKVIKRVFEIAPESIRPEITTVEFSTDGLDRSLAYVTQNTEYTQFRLSIDEKDAIDANGEFTRDGLETLIHEFGHIITFDKNQMNIDEVNKEEIDISKAYKEGSYLNDFYNQFWKDIYSDYKKENNNDFYNKYKDQFVTDYAAVNIAEDIAECFRVYVFDIETPANTIAAKKVDFFNNYPEMVKIKNHFKEELNL